MNPAMVDSSVEQTSAAQIPPPANLPSSGTQKPARPNLALGKPLTAKQRTIWDLTRPIPEGGQGKTNAQTAAVMGISVPVVNKTLHVVYKKLGLNQGPGKRPSMRSAEYTDPEKTAAVIDASTNPDAELKLGKVREALREAGLPVASSEALIRRLRTKFYGGVLAVRNLKTQEILDLLGQKIHLALTYMDDKVVSEASFRDLALGTTAMIEKRALLRGEPTQIISDHERAKIHELVPKLLEEARRRGLTIEGTVTEKVIGPSQPAA